MSMPLMGLGQGARETCGAVSAMAMIAGVLAGYDSANDIEEKKKLYALVNGMLEEFREKNGSTVCRELLKGIKTSPVPSERTEEYYRTRPCVRFVESAARIVSETLKIRERADGGRRADALDTSYTVL